MPGPRALFWGPARQPACFHCQVSTTSHVGKLRGDESMRVWAQVSDSCGFCYVFFCSGDSSNKFLGKRTCELLFGVFFLCLLHPPKGVHNLHIRSASLFCFGRDGLAGEAEATTTTSFGRGCHRKQWWEGEAFSTYPEDPLIHTDGKNPKQPPEMYKTL